MFRLEVGSQKFRAGCSLPKQRAEDLGNGGKAHLRGATRLDSYRIDFKEKP